MKKLKRLNEHILFKSLLGILALLVLYSTVVGGIGYRDFSNVLMAQYTESAFHSADTASRIIDGDRIGAYLESGGSTEEYLEILGQMEDMCNTQGTTFIYLIVPDRTDYAHITFVFSTINENSPYTRYDFGYVRETTNDDYRGKYRALYEGQTDRAVVIRDKGYIETDPHLTAMIPVRASDGSVQGILCVQEQMEALYRARHDFLMGILRTLIVVSLLVLIGQGYYLNKMLLSPIRRIMREARRFAAEHVLPEKSLREKIRNRDEIGVLAESVDQMEEQIGSYVESITRMTVEKQRISSELSLATKIQIGILPQVEPLFSGRREFDLAAKMDPARDVGGDFYDFYFIDEDHLALTIADVSGKGVPAALFMMVSKALIKNRMLSGDTPGQALGHVNDQLVVTNRADMFVTVWLMILTISTGECIVANAGHEHPAVRRGSGEYELMIYRHSPPIAVVADVDFEEHCFTMQSGDSFFVYTDGAAEATDTSEEEFGQERLCNALNEEPDADAERVIRHVSDAIGAFTGGTEQFDDITMLCFRFLGPDGGGS